LVKQAVSSFAGNHRNNPAKSNGCIWKFINMINMASKLLLYVLLDSERDEDLVFGNPDMEEICR
jgi:hypothetical protein